MACGRPGRGAQLQERPKVCGPESIRTLRGKLLGREVALVCCGESHEDAIDLTRSGGIVDVERDWLEVPHTGAGAPGPDPAQALASKAGVTLAQAKAWAQSRLEDDEGDDEDGDSSEDEHDGARLVFTAQGTGAKSKGAACLFPSDVERSSAHPISAETVEFDWADVDVEARTFNRRRLAGEEVPLSEHDALIAARKLERLDEGLELFDDWLVRMAYSSQAKVEVVLEAPVAASEVELHIEPGVTPAPPAHECLRCIELDSDEDTDEENDPDDGTGSFIDYLRRRLQDQVSTECIHGVDPRDLGDCDDDALRDTFQALLPEPLPRDAEDAELEALGAPTAKRSEEDDESDDESEDGKQRGKGSKESGKPKKPLPPPVPSWEAFFGAASELLYYSPQVKADYTPFLVHCVRNPEGLRRFFEALYFRTVPEALALLRLAEADRPLSRVRALSFHEDPGAPLQRRPGSQGLVPCLAAPLDRYLKARGTNPPRTWVSGMAERLRKEGAGKIVDAARAWIAHEVEYFLSDPKEADPEGDYFVAWLRECHRDIYDDVDHSDPEELRKMKWAQSLEHPRSRKQRHNLRDIVIPAFEDAWSEIAKFDPEKRTTTKRERVISKILVDAFQLKLVDLAAILTVADVVGRAEKGAPVVVVFYAGGDHAKAVIDFWQGQGFSHKGLPNKGMVGKDDWEDDEPRGLDLPPYLHDFKLLF